MLYNSSDHFAITCDFKLGEYATNCSYANNGRQKLHWDRCDTSIYQINLSTSLSSLNLPMKSLNCNGLCAIMTGKPGINTSTSILNGKAGEENVRHEFTEQFKNVYTPNNAHVDV